MHVSGRDSLSSIREVGLRTTESPKPPTDIQKADAAIAEWHIKQAGKGFSIMALLNPKKAMKDAAETEGRALETAVIAQLNNSAIRSKISILKKDPVHMAQRAAQRLGLNDADKSVAKQVKYPRGSDSEKHQTAINRYDMLIKQKKKEILITAASQSPTSSSSGSDKLTSLPTELTESLPTNEREILEPKQVSKKLLLELDNLEKFRTFLAGYPKLTPEKAERQRERYETIRTAEDPGKIDASAIWQENISLQPRYEKSAPRDQSQDGATFAAGPLGPLAVPTFLW